MFSRTWCPKPFYPKSFCLGCELDSSSQWLFEFPNTFEISGSIGLTLSIPSITFMFSKSSIMSISFDFLAFAFCLPLEGIRSFCKRKEVYYLYVANCNFINCNVLHGKLLLSPGHRVPGINSQISITCMNQ